jgi:hypothetical protein
MDLARRPNPDIAFLRTCHVLHDDLAIAAEYVLGTADQEASPENRNKVSSLPRVQAWSYSHQDVEFDSLTVPLVRAEDLCAPCLDRPVVRALLSIGSPASGNSRACVAVIFFPRNDRIVIQGLQICLSLV